MGGIIAWEREGKYLRSAEIRRIPYVGNWLADHVPRWRDDSPRKRAASAAERRARVSHATPGDVGVLWIWATAMQAAPALAAHTSRDCSRAASQGGAGSVTYACPLIVRIEESDCAYNYWLHGRQLAQAGAGKLFMLLIRGSMDHSHAGSPAITER